MDQAIALAHELSKNNRGDYVVGFANHTFYVYLKG